VSESPAGSSNVGYDPGSALLVAYDTAMPVVYGYLLARCGGAPVAEELTSETFLAAVDALQRRQAHEAVTTPWLIGVARHKLVDHWRRQARDDRRQETIERDLATEPPDLWEGQLDALLARETLDQLLPDHRAALTLRYLDDLPVGEVAALLDRSVHAAEGLLVRARAAFRRAYVAKGGCHE